MKREIAPIKSGTTSYVWNTDGTLFKKTWDEGNRVEFTYDNYKRVTQMRGYKGYDPAEVVDYTYDTDPFGGGSYALGRLSTISYDAGALSLTEKYAWSKTGAPTRKAVQRDGFTEALEVAYAYDTEGKMTSMTPPWTTTPYVYGFDDMGRPEEMSYGTLDYVKGVEYNAAGQWTYMEDVWEESPVLRYRKETRTFNVLGQLTRQFVDRPPFDFDFTYTYPATENAGRISSSNLHGVTTQYEYDQLNRLTAATATGAMNWEEEYGYDGYGNRMSSVGNINPATNRFYGPYYDYDSNGNLTTMPGAVVSRIMSYDEWNRLESVTDYGDVESYGYSPDGQRVYKATSGEDPVFYFRGAGGEMMAEYGLETWTATGFTVDAAVRYRHFGGKLLGMETSVSTYKVLQRDRIGSVVGDGEYARYLRPYGEAHYAPELNQPRFATYYRDEQTGFDYAGQRYYSSQIGRFLTADPYRASGGPADPGSWNRYAYVRGDPVNRIDPWGLADTTPFRKMPNQYPETEPHTGLRYVFYPFAYPGSEGSVVRYGITPAPGPPHSEAGSGSGFFVDLARWGSLKWAVKFAMGALTKPDCRDLFHGAQPPAAVLQEMFSGTSEYGSITFKDNLESGGVAQAIYGPQVWNADAGQYYFASSGIEIERTLWSTSPHSVAENARTLIHELGHVYNIVGALGDSDFQYDLDPETGDVDWKAQNANSELEKKCIP